MGLIVSYHRVDDNFNRLVESKRHFCFSGYLYWEFDLIFYYIVENLYVINNRVYDPFRRLL